jgi:hypothetical protein
VRRIKGEDSGGCGAFGHADSRFVWEKSIKVFKKGMLSLDLVWLGLD